MSTRLFDPNNPDMALEFIKLILDSAAAMDTKVNGFEITRALEEACMRTIVKCVKKNDTLITFLTQINDKFGMNKSEDLLQRIAESNADTAYQAQWALTARMLLND